MDNDSSGLRSTAFGTVQDIFSPLTSNDRQSLNTDSSPEPLSEEDIARIRSRVVEMGLTPDGKSKNAEASNVTAKEQELGSMVVKLLNSSIEPSQVLRQAEFISWLTAQRDLLIHSFEEERNRWNAEKEGWARMAEALISRRWKDRDAFSRDEGVEHQCATYESENKTLREKLHYAQARYSTLESELNKLKPLLFMQPPSSLYASSPESRHNRNQPSRNFGPTSEAKGRVKPNSSSGTREEQPLNDADGEPDNMNTPMSHPQENGATSARSVYSEHYRKTGASSYQNNVPHSPFRAFPNLSGRLLSQQTPTRSSNIPAVSQTPSTQPPASSRKARQKSKRNSIGNLHLAPLSADARTEHLLLAARKIGRERANMISSFMKHIEREKERLQQEQEAERVERERLERLIVPNTSASYYRKDTADPAASPSVPTTSHTLSMPKTPKRGTSTGQAGTRFLSPALLTPRSDLYMHQNLTPNSFVFVGTPTTIPYGGMMMNTPRPADQQVTHGQQKTELNQTPMATAPAMRPTNPPTPLDSLLSAARSMMDDSIDPPMKSNTRRRANVFEPPESPLPKRRRTGNNSASSSLGREMTEILGASTTPAVDRVKSALDVLADQAAAAVTSEQGSPPKGLTSKGKGRANLSSSRDEDEDTNEESTPRRRLYPIAEDVSSSSATGSPLQMRSRSKIVPNQTTSPLKKRNSKSTSTYRTTSTARMIYSPHQTGAVAHPGRTIDSTASIAKVADGLNSMDENGSSTPSNNSTMEDMEDKGKLKVFDNASSTFGEDQDTPTDAENEKEAAAAEGTESMNTLA